MGDNRMLDVRHECFIGYLQPFAPREISLTEKPSPDAGGRAAPREGGEHQAERDEGQVSDDQ
ncbi:hypothetical protein ABZT45_09805, partial [Streptomyces sp. NPDC005356]|uniref:hypothetical protein n=1 Tax=Streptomyces sp. NPDC005356 TaxID=3157167 RepID=UPI00339FF7CB